MLKLIKTTFYKWNKWVAILKITGQYSFVLGSIWVDRNCDKETVFGNGRGSLEKFNVREKSKGWETFAASNVSIENDDQS